MKIGAMNHPKADWESEIGWISRHFDFIDFTYEAPRSFEFDPKKIKDSLVAHGLSEVVGHTAPALPAIYPIREIREISFEELKKAVDFFKQIGSKKMNIHPFYNAPNMSENEIIEANLEVLYRLNQYAKEQKIHLMLENFITPFDTPEIFQTILEAVPGLNVHLDVGHCNLEGNATKIVERFFNKLGEKIIHMHMHDNDGDSDEHLPLGCGCGEIDWKKMIQVIKSSGYDGTVTLEVFCDDLDYLILSKDKLRELWEKTK